MKRIIKLIVKIVVFAGIFLAAEHLIHFCAFDDTKAVSRLMIHELYHQGEELSSEGILTGGIDVLFCGASHVQLSFDPSVTDEVMGGNTFNAGSSAQPLEATDALIREAAALYDLKQVYVDLDYSIATRDEVNLESIYVVSDYMRPSLNKVKFLLHAAPAKYYINSFLPLGQGRTLVRDPEKIAQIVREKFSYNYRHYISEVDSYQGKGFIASYVHLEPADNEQTGTRSWMQLQEAVFEEEMKETPPSVVPDSIPEQDQKTIKDIIRFCKDEGIALTFVVTPMSDYFLTHLTGEYDHYVSMMREFLSENGAALYDFNLVKPSYLDLRDVKYYTDSNHLNRDGAKLFSEVFAKFFTGEIPEDALFYQSYEEKLSDPDFLK